MDIEAWIDEIFDATFLESANAAPADTDGALDQIVETALHQANIDKSILPTTTHGLWYTSDTNNGSIVDTSTEPEYIADPTVDLLFETAFRTAKLGGPLHVNSTRQRTYGGDTNDSGYVLSTARGERNVTGITRQTDVESDKFMEDILRFIDTRAYQELIDDHPDLTKPGAAALLTDKKTPIPAMNLLCQNSGDYDLGDDLSFNLTPQRSHFIRHFYGMSVDNEMMLSDVGEELAYRKKLDAIGIALDAQCSRAEGCVYTSYFFPTLGQHFRSGPVAYGKCKEQLITEIPQLLNSQKNYVEFVDLLYHLFVDTAVNAQTLCICCILVDQAANQFCAKSGGPAHGNDMRRDDVFLLRRSDSHIANNNDHTLTRSLAESDYFKHLINVNGCLVFQLADVISMRFYSVSKIDNDWVVTKCTSDCI